MDLGGSIDEEMEDVTCGLCLVTKPDGGRPEDEEENEFPPCSDRFLSPMALPALSASLLPNESLAFGAWIVKGVCPPAPTDEPALVEDRARGVARRVPHVKS